jgi:hypothetical protein
MVLMVQGKRKKGSVAVSGAAVAAALEAGKSAAAAAAEAAKQSKLAAEKRARDKAQAAAASSAAAAAAAAAVTADAAVARRALQRERKRLRAAAAGSVSETDVARLCASLDGAQLAQLCRRLEECLKGEQPALIAAAIASPQQQMPPMVAAVAHPPRALAAAQPQPWTAEELRALDRALKVYPAGMPRRWEAVASSLGSGRAAADVATAAKSRGVAAKAREAVPGGTSVSDDYSAFLGQRKGTGEVTAPADCRDAGAVAAAAEGDWSDAQTAALLDAMRVCPKGSTPAERTARWIAIAARVEGKDAAACVARFNELAAQTRAAATAGGATTAAASTGASQAHHRGL